MIKTAFGYLFAGDALDQWNPPGPRGAGINEEPSDPWAWHTTLVYTF